MFSNDLNEKKSIKLFYLKKDQLEKSYVRRATFTWSRAAEFSFAGHIPFKIKTPLLQKKKVRVVENCNKVVAILQL